MKQLTLDDLAARWQCSKKTVQRDTKRFDLMPVDVRGNQPLFAEDDVADMELRRKQIRLAQLGYELKPANGKPRIKKILTVTQAKRLAKVGGAK